MLRSNLRPGTVARSSGLRMALAGFVIVGGLGAAGLGLVTQRPVETPPELQSRAVALQVESDDLLSLLAAVPAERSARSFAPGGLEWLPSRFAGVSNNVASGGAVHAARVAITPLPNVAPDPVIAELPPPRPVELKPADPTRLAGRRGRALPPEEDKRGFFERLLGLPAPAGPGAVTASLGTAPIAPDPGPRLAPTPAPAPGQGVAVYDISARTVTLPSGEKLEAHSGLGAKMDDVRFVHVRMQGATPPGTYDLTEREAPFHGVRALRLNPIGGSAAVHGRAGLLTHSYLLGPSGQSNGCVSFRDYDRFLQAYLRGEVRQLVVVPGQGDGVIGFFNRAFAGRHHGSTRVASAGSD